MTFQNLLLVGVGGFIGTIARYGSSVWLQSFNWNINLGTLFVNILGSFLIGCLYALGTERLGNEVFLVLTVGVMGGFTTFSAFSLDSFILMREGRFVLAAIYISSMLFLGVLATFVGFQIFTKLFNQV